MTKNELTLAAETGGTEDTRFNALKHGVLSRYAVLPWENATEYRDLVAALAAEHAPQGPTEEHLVEELAGIFWRKRRLRLAEAAAHRRGLEATKSPYGQTVNSALGPYRLLWPIRMGRQCDPRHSVRYPGGHRGYGAGRSDHQARP